MRELPDLISFRYAGKKILVCHGSPDVINQGMFESISIEKKREILKEYNCDIVIAGYTGIPFSQDLGNGKHWVNAGVIGMPANDGTQSGFYVILNDKDGEFSLKFKRLDFDFETTAEKMKENNLSNEYIMTLETGLWSKSGVEKKQEGEKIKKKKYNI